MTDRIEGVPTNWNMLILDSMELLERDTAAYFQEINDPAAEEESRMEAAFGQMVDKINFDE